MSEEVIYKFVRGKGWVVDHNDVVFQSRKFNYSHSIAYETSQLEMRIQTAYITALINGDSTSEAIMDTIERDGLLRDVNVITTSGGGISVTGTIRNTLDQITINGRVTLGDP